MAERGDSSLTAGTRRWDIVGTKLRTQIDLSAMGPDMFAKDSLADVAVFILDLPSRIQLDSRGPTVKLADIVEYSFSGIRKREELVLGDELYFVGFPFGIGADVTLEPVVRSGSVAWMGQGSSEFLIDAFSFGGNSGSPVFAKAVPVGRSRGVAMWDKPLLVGMVCGHEGQDLQGVLTQPDPDRPDIQRQDVNINFGLVRCVWIDNVLSLIESMVPGHNYPSR
jgi:hypothetical protein